MIGYDDPPNPGLTPLKEVPRVVWLIQIVGTNMIAGMSLDETKANDHALHLRSMGFNTWSTKHELDVFRTPTVEWK